MDEHKTIIQACGSSPNSRTFFWPKKQTACVFHITASGHVALKLYEREIATYLREPPRLLSEGRRRQHVLIKGDQVVGVWKTQGEAIQAGSERFGLEPIFVKTIDPRDTERFALVFAQKDSSCMS